MSKAASKFCLVYYHVPEDKDDPEFPNAFGLNTAIDDVRLLEIRKLFPLEGDYIFRFKTKLGNSNVWMDIKEDSKIPQFGGKIVMKASRMSWERTENRQSAEPERVREEPKASSTTANRASGNNSYSDNASKQQTYANTTQSQAQAGSFGADDFNLLSNSYQSNTNPTNAAASTNAHDHHDLLNFGHQDHSNSYKVSQDTNKKQDLLSFDNLF